MPEVIELVKQSIDVNCGPFNVKKLLIDYPICFALRNTVLCHTLPTVWQNLQDQLKTLLSTYIYIFICLFD